MNTVDSVYPPDTNCARRRLRQGKAADSLRAYTAAAALRRPQEPDLMAVAVDYVTLGDYSDADRWFSRQRSGLPMTPWPGIIAAYQIPAHPLRRYLL